MDTQNNISCPACGKKMDKIFDYKANVYIDICTNGCGGIFFDNRELEKFDEIHEDADLILDSLEGKTFQLTDTSQTRVCPVCNVPMVKIGAGKGYVEIDVCNTCGGKFLDNGELQQIRASIEKDNSLFTTLIDSICEDPILSKKKNVFEKVIKHYFEQ